MVVELEPSKINISHIDISPNDVNTEFDEQKILSLAYSIASLQGLLRIPIVKEVGIDKYELIFGLFEYKAYQKALEINPELPKGLRVFIVNEENEAKIREQIKVFEDLGNIYSSATDNEEEIRLKLTTSNFFSIIEDIKNNQKMTSEQTKEDYSNLTNLIEKKLPKPLPPLEAFNKIKSPEITGKVKKNLAFLGASKQEKIIKKLTDIKDKNPDHEFKSFGQVIYELGKGCISKDKMLDIIDNWN